MSFSDKDRRRSPSPTVEIPLHNLESNDNSHLGPYNDRGYSSQEKYSSGDWADFLDLMLTKLAIAITPSFLQHHVGGQPAPPPTKQHAIAALDGLRGWASLLVFNFHFLFTYTWKIAVGWGFNGENYGIWQLPILHMVVSGHIMVAIFFVISGYVLSYKPLKMIRSRSWEQTFTALASSTFRRALRLYLPSVVGITLVMLAVRAGVYDYSHHVINQGYTIQGTNEQHPPVFKTFSRQYWDYYYTLANLMDPFNWSLYYNYYNPHLWTIPVEFRCSFALFLTMLGTSRLHAPLRMTLVASMVWFCMRYGRWDVVLFLSGNLMAEADLINGTWERPPLPPSATIGPKWLPQQFRPSIRKWWIAVFIAGLYFGSCPNIGFKWTPFYMWLWDVTPWTYPEQHRFPQTIGAVLIVMGINRSPDVQKLFTTPLSQYLGKISFAFYIVHGPILHSLGYSLMPNVWSVVGKETNFQYCLGFLVGWMICLPLAIWMGDIFWRAVDIPSVKFARWLEDKVITKSPSE